MSVRSFVAGGLLIVCCASLAQVEVTPIISFILDDSADSPQRGEFSATRRAPVERTNQTGCWDEDGNTIDCADTGQDGEYQAGVPWPDPRFIDNGDGTVLDQLTGLVWLKDGTCLTSTSGIAQVANTLASGQCGLTDGSATGDWHVPTINELISLVDFGTLSGDLPAGHPFTLPTPATFNNVYLSSTYQVRSSSSSLVSYLTLDLDTNRLVSTNRLLSVHNQVNSVLYVLAVRHRNPATGNYHLFESTAGAPVQMTEQRTCLNTADRRWRNCRGFNTDGEFQWGIAFPEPRFVDNRDGTVTDRLTGLVWMTDFECLTGLATSQKWEDALTTANGFSDGDCGVSDGSSAGDWRLPNVNELISIHDAKSIYYQSAILGLEFPRLWTSTTRPDQTENAFATEPSVLRSESKDVTFIDFILVRDP
ncbi:MAG: DUF1566 domain-containing protein [Pseudomonadota bacterium]